MQTKTSTTIGFIGLGLIGGSIAKAIRQYYPDYQILAFDKSRETLALAMQDGTIDISCTAIDEQFSHCSYLFLCAPISYNNAYLSQLKDLIHPDCILTDVGSVKTAIHEEITRLGLDANFIGGHPMAGSEKSGFSNSKAHLIENAYYILTPSDKVSSEKLEDYRCFVQSLKALPIVLDYRLHDTVTGTISHLPHIIASCLVNFVKSTDTKEELMKLLAAGGFKDITRIASSSPIMWQQICLKNKDNISRILGAYIEELNRAKFPLMPEMNGNYFHSSSHPETTGIPCRITLQDRSKRFLPCTVTLSMKPEESRPLPRFWPAITSALKILESFITGNLKKGYCASNFTKRTPL